MPCPEAIRVLVSADLAGALLEVARAMPARENQAYYDDALQRALRDGVRARCRAGFDWLVAEVRRRLRRAPYAATMTGLDFDPENRLFIALNRAFGQMVSKPLQKPRAQLVHMIHHRADLVAPASGKAYTELFHTDGVDMPGQVDLLSMVCLRPDASGEGQSRLIEMHALAKEFEARYGPELLKVLQNEPVPWLMAPEFGAEVVWRPVLTAESLCWRRYTIDLALARPGIAIAPHVVEALDAMEALLDAPDSAHEWLMREGEFLMMDNCKCLHARTRVSNPQSRRLMMRSWMRVGTQTPSAQREADEVSSAG